MYVHEVYFIDGPMKGKHYAVPGDTDVPPPQVYVNVLVRPETGWFGDDVEVKLNKVVYHRVVNSFDDGPLWVYTIEA